MSPAAVLGLLAGLGGTVERVMVVGCEPATLTDGHGSEPGGRRRRARRRRRRAGAARDIGRRSAHPGAGVRGREGTGDDPPVPDARAAGPGGGGRRPVGTGHRPLHEDPGACDGVARYRIDPARSRVAIDATSSLHPIHSETDGLEGWLELDVDGGGARQHGRRRLGPTSSCPSTGCGRATRWRTASCAGASTPGASRPSPVTSSPWSRSGADGRYRVRGDVTFKGVTRPREDEMTVSADGDGGLRLQGSSVFDIRDFGMEPPRILHAQGGPRRDGDGRHRRPQGGVSACASASPARWSSCSRATSTSPAST